MKKSLPVILLLAGTVPVLMLAEVVVSHLSQATAQVACCVPPAMPVMAARWAKYKTVTVIIEGGEAGLTASERQSIEDAFKHWNNLNSCATCINISFTGFQFGDDPSGADDTYWVQYKDEEGLASTGMNNASARTTLRRPIRRGHPTFLSLYVRSTMKHEIGHTVGIDDKFNCSQQCTIMCSPGTATAEITSCDDDKVIGIYCPTPTPTPESPPPCGTAGIFVLHPPAAAPVTLVRASKSQIPVWKRALGSVT